jgi:hypothetical protein
MHWFTAAVRRESEAICLRIAAPRCSHDVVAGVVGRDIYAGLWPFTMLTQAYWFVLKAPIARLPCHGSLRLR